MTNRFFGLNETLGLIFLAIGLLLVEGSNNKLILGGLIFLLFGIIDFLKVKRKDHTKEISVYSGTISISLGLFALGGVYLLRENPNLFGSLFVFIILLEFILLYFFGSGGTFKKIMFVLFSFPLIWTIYSIFNALFKIGLIELKIPDIILAGICLLTLCLIYWAIICFLNKYLSKYKIISFLRTVKGIWLVLILLSVAIFVGFMNGKITLGLFASTITKIPLIGDIIIVASFIGVIKFFFNLPSKNKN